MKDKRNCSINSYPMYPNMMMPPMYPMPPANMVGTNTIEQQLNSIQQELNTLDQRITRLEKMNSTSSNTTYNKYNDSNYYMV